MIRHTIEISREPCHLATRDEQLLILRRDTPSRPLPAHPPNLAGQVPMEDLGILMVDERETTYSHSALVKMAEHGAALVVCGRDHLPCGMFLPLSTNTEVLTRLGAQLNTTRPTVKRLWTQIVAAKVRAQAANLGHAPAVRARLLGMARRIRSGDPENIEAQAAQAYWPALFDGASNVAPPFRRRPGERDAAPPNNLLDYGYAAIRAAVARAIVSAGLLPALGLKHSNRSNAFCLADDLVEPLRPLVDARTRDLAAAGRLDLDQPTKAELLILLTTTVETDGDRGPLQVSLVRYVASLVRCLANEAAALSIPKAAGQDGNPPEPADRDADDEEES